MRASRPIGIAVFLTALLISNISAQNVSEFGVVHGRVTRFGGDEAFSAVQITLEGAVNPEAMKTVLNAAAGAGITVTPPQGATAAEVVQLLSNTAAARGLPVGQPAIQNIVNNAVGAQNWPTVMSDGDGRFTFSQVKPGRYTVRATRDGFFGKPVAGVYPATDAINIAVGAGEAQQASLAMVQGAIIGGRVYDPTGAVVSNMTVQAYSVAYQTGFSLLQTSVTKTTDDRGEYRLFWLPPGDYYVGATTRAAAPFAGGQPGARTFYPSVTRLSEAQPITIRGGEDFRGIDIALRPAQLFKISGQITSFVAAPPNENGSPLVMAFLHLADRDLQTPNDNTAANQSGRISLTPNTGVFEITNVPPGSYELLGRVADPSVGTGLGAFSWGRVIVDVEDRDVSGVPIAINPSPALKGTVRVVGGGNLPQGVRIALSPMGGSSRVALYQLVATRGTPVAADGSFSVASVPPGQFRVAALPGLPPTFYIADVRQSSASVFDSGFAIGSRDPEPIEIWIASGAGVVDGVVEDGPTKFAPGAVVALIPEPRRLENRALYAVTNTDAAGRFSFRGVAPGDYQVLAWESTPPNAYQSLSFLRKYEGRGKNVRVPQSGTVSVEVTVVK
ncbi:MAG TPA: carboxypeptidase regulatory-like domain-containing protein [Terriglobia bacterium]|nr:carboxypeptidase regulatory-like domain-containing protein [Terriglobia bacterium]